MKKLGGVSIFSPLKLYDSTGVEIPANTGAPHGTLRVETTIGKELLEEFKVFVEFVYHASATKGGRVDIVPYGPDLSTVCSDAYCTAVRPNFAAGSVRSKIGSPINAVGLEQFYLYVVNEDPAQVLTLKKLYII